jgi:dienelactone hydrolase
MRRFRFLGVPALVLALVAAPGLALAAEQPAGPLDLTGELNGAAYEIRVPAHWNGTLVMYAHGYRDAADHPGETDDRSADAFIDEEPEQAMLAAGYAVAGSAYASNGWAVADGIEDTKALVEYFRDVVGQPRTTLLAGFSMGSLVTFESMEHFGGIYDGAMPSCAVGAGAPRAFDGTLAIASAYAAVFGWPAAWGTPSDVRDDLDFESEVLPVLISQLTAPGGFGRFEFIRLVTGVPRGPEWPFAIWFFTTEGRAELERRAGGPVVQNLDHNYAVSAADRAYLAGLGVGASAVDGYLADMTANRVGAYQPARHYLELYADYSGKIKSPVLTLDTTVDALVPPAHISAYNATVAAAGRSDLVANAWTSGVGHCNFTTQQLVTAVQALERWVQTGQRPGPLPASQGFVDFTPPPWPQP